MPARSQFAAAIAQAEGFGVSGAIPTRNNNPGDLRNWSNVPADSQGYSVFLTPQAGWDALESQLNLIRNGASSYYTVNMSIAQMGDRWAAGDANWARNVAAYLGVSTAAMIGPLLGVPAAAASPDSPVVVTDPQTGAMVSVAPPAPDFTAPSAPSDLLIIAIAVGGFILLRRILS